MEAETNEARYGWADEFMKRLAGTTSDYKAEWSAVRYMVGGKMYAMQGGDKFGEPILTIKLRPETSEFLRAKYPEYIKPGYYMNKTHWNSLYLHGNVEDETVKAMLTEAHGLVFSSLPKRVQAELAEKYK